MRKRSETKPKQGFPLAAPHPHPAWRALVEQGWRGKGRGWAGSCRDPYDVVRCALPLNKGLENVGHIRRLVLASR